ncbi:MAG: peptidase dimerization domain-containing protein [Gemmataceae bacterium]|nr:peptidase dimerization domain-containing protein [Gemmataceae bacterium]
MRPLDEPDVIAAGAAFVARLGKMQSELSSRKDGQAGHETVFVGQMHAGEIYNQYPQECLVEGTRRWLPGVDRKAVEAEFRAVLAEIPVPSSCEFRFIRDPFRLDPADALVSIFQQARRAMGDAPLPLAAKPFVDDGNSFFGLGPIPAITHGPRSGGQHTTSEWADLDDMARVAVLYAATAAAYCEEAPWRG